MTEEQVERIVCAKTDAIDRRYLAGKLTEAEYNAEIRALAQWAERATSRRDSAAMRYRMRDNVSMLGI
jgi:hypothetical protein